LIARNNSTAANRSCGVLESQNSRSFDSSVNDVTVRMLLSILADCTSSLIASNSNPPFPVRQRFRPHRAAVPAAAKRGR
jgi:hypothetical protein